MRVASSVRIALSALLVVVAAGCGGGGSSAEDDKTLVVVTHDSWAMPKQVLADFEKQTGITVKVQQQGDAGQLTNKLVLTKDSPLADGVYGIDNTYGPRAVGNGVLTTYRSPKLPPSGRSHLLAGHNGDYLTPIDYSDVCVNVDDVWFREHHLAPPRTLDDLTLAAYRNLFVTPGATTSSPGLAFLYATVAAKGDRWTAYWRKLMANGAKVTAGWSDAYEVDFTAGGGAGDRPIVTSYSSSPPFTIPEDGKKPSTHALLDTCFRQVEYAGVLAGSKNPEGMRKFIDFMLGREFQAALPENMYVYPIDDAVELPKEWAAYGSPAPDPFTLDPEEMSDDMGRLLREWRDVTSR